MADNIQQIQNELADLERQIAGLASELSTTFINNFTSARNKAEDLTKEFSKGKDITKQIDREMRNLKNKIDSSYSLEAKLNDQLAKQLANHGRNSVAKANIIQKQIDQLQKERNLNIELEYQYRELEKITEEKKKQSTVSSYIRDKIKLINKEYFSTLGILKFIVNAALKADEQTTELAKSLGIGKDQANGIRQEFVKYSRAANDSFVTTTKLLEAQFQLSEQLGVSVKYSGKQAEDFSRLTKLMGLSAEQAGKLARLSVVNGTSIENTAKSIIKGSAASQRANRLSVDQRTILKDVANLSEGILIKFQGNPEALGAAVVQARKLGLTLSEVDKIGESLLNFATSIENELAAELITGRKLNFERAREAALLGDQATLMKEIASQAGSLTDFQNMNVIAQRSLAEAFGLSRDEMSKMLIEQEKINKLGDVSQMTLDEQLKALRAQGEPLDSVLYKQIQQQSAQEKFNNAVEKLQDLLGNLVAGPLGKLIDGFSNLVNNSWALYTAMVAIGAISLTRTIASLSLMTSQLVTAGVASAATASALTFGLSAAAIVAGIAVIAGMMNSATEEAKAQSIKDGIAPAGNGPFTITDGFGRTAITATGDGLAVSPNINRGGGDTGIIAAIEKLASRPAVAYINGKEAFANSLGSTSALSTSQMQNTSYRLA